MSASGCCSNFVHCIHSFLLTMKDYGSSSGFIVLAIVNHKVYSQMAQWIAAVHSHFDICKRKRILPICSANTRIQKRWGCLCMHCIIIVTMNAHSVVLRWMTTQCPRNKWIVYKMDTKCEETDQKFEYERRAMRKGRATKNAETNFIWCARDHLRNENQEGRVSLKIIQGYRLCVK